MLVGRSRTRRITIACAELRPNLGRCSGCAMAHGGKRVHAEFSDKGLAMQVGPSSGGRIRVPGGPRSVGGPGRYGTALVRKRPARPA
jgi:hypothetical protein